MLPDEISRNHAIVGGALIVVILAGMLFHANTIPFCQQNFALTDDNRFHYTNQSTYQELRQTFGEETVIKKLPDNVDAQGVLSLTAYRSTANNTFWVVRDWSGGLDDVYGPFPGKPRTCQFYPELLF